MEHVSVPKASTEFRNISTGVSEYFSSDNFKLLHPLHGRITDEFMDMIFLIRN